MASLLDLHRGVLLTAYTETELADYKNPPAIQELTGDELERDVARFLIQSTFGSNAQEIEALKNSIIANGGDRMQGYADWILSQMGQDPDKGKRSTEPLYANPVEMP